MNMKISKIALACTLGLASVSAMAGTPGATSNDTIPVTLTVNELVVVGDTDGIALGTYTPGTAPTGSDDICAARLSAGTLEVTLTSTNGGAGVFSLADTADSIDYNVTWNAGAVTEGATVTRAATANGGTAIANCAADSGAGGATVAVTVPETNITTGFTGAGDGAFSDTITVTVGPTP